jgi:transposase-like protein
MTKNKTYTAEYRKKILDSLKPPQNKTVPQIVREEGISRSTVHSWIHRAREQGDAFPTIPLSSGKASGAAKFKVVLETYTLNEMELSAYCREHGLYVSEVKDWIRQMEQSFDKQPETAELRAEKERSKKLEKELLRKEKALAEAAALLVLQKKAKAIWGDPEED